MPFMQCVERLSQTKGERPVTHKISSVKLVCTNQRVWSPDLTTTKNIS